jgi:hypothetical protein
MASAVAPNKNPAGAGFLIDPITNPTHRLPGYFSLEPELGDDLGDAL